MNTSPELIALGHAHMTAAHELILAGAALGLLSIAAGLVSRKIGAPVLLVFLVMGMLEGEDGPGGIPFDDFYTSYLVGSIALAIILFEGGLKTTLPVLRSAFWPALTLAVVGVGLTAGIVGGAVYLLIGVPFAAAMLVGAAIAPTDAAAVAALLRPAQLAVPERVLAVLEVESGLNDPMSVFLTLLLIRMIAEPQSVSTGTAALLFVREMGGGALIGLAGGLALVGLLRWLVLEAATAMVLVLACGLTVFGLAQVLGTSGFLAIYIAAVMAGATEHRHHRAVEDFFEGLAWLSQIILFLMLGLLVTPHELPPVILAGLVTALVLILLARPAAVFACLMPFGFTAAQSAFTSWVGLRGAVPIYLSIIPALADPHRDRKLFAGVFMLVVISLVVQGWTIKAVARWLGFGQGVRVKGA